MVEKCVHPWVEWPSTLPLVKVSFLFWRLGRWYSSIQKRKCTQNVRSMCHNPPQRSLVFVSQEKKYFHEGKKWFLGFLEYVYVCICISPLLQEYPSPWPVVGINAVFVDPGNEATWNQWCMCNSKLKPVYGYYDFLRGGVTCLGDDKKWLNSRPMVRNWNCFYFSLIPEELVQLLGLWAILKFCNLCHWSWAALSGLQSSQKQTQGAADSSLLILSSGFGWKTPNLP